MPSDTHHSRIDPDFSREVLQELYEYRHKRRLVAWLLWGTLGWFGAHRFYLRRTFTGLAMLFTGGGALLWWIVDATLLNDLVAAYNEEQEQRRKAGLPPKDLAFMPPLHDEALEATPEWITRWEARSRGRQALRLAGDLLVLYVAGDVLGRLSSVQGVPEAIVAVAFLALITVVGAGPAWLHELPVVKDFVRWSHQLRLFYYHNKPANPFSLLIRPVLGTISAPFRTRARAEVRMYAELGAVFTAIFLLLDIVQDILVPAVSPTASFQVSSVLGGWVRQGMVTFFAIYAFAAPIGAVLTLYLLTRPTHTVPRILAAWTLVAILLGVIR